MKGNDMMRNRRGSATGVIIVGISLCIFLGPCSGCKMLKELWREITTPILPKEIIEEDQKEAKKKMALIFSSAQNTYAHKSRGIMASSIEELGDGFTIGKHGALIYEDIWAARITCPKKEADERAKNNAQVRELLSRPYRYGVMKVQGISSEAKDNLTTCIVAVPADDKSIPALVMLAGPVDCDPQDFMKPWPVVKVDNLATVRKIRGWVVDRARFDMDKKALLFK